MSLDDLRERPFVVNLWASWGGPCRVLAPIRDTDGIIGTAEFQIQLTGNVTLQASDFVF